MIDFEHVTKVYETQNDEMYAGKISISTLMKRGIPFYPAILARQPHSQLIQMEEKSPPEGKIYINDQDLTTIKRRKVPYLRRQMGAVFQDFRLIPTMTVYENVAFAMRVTNINNKTIKNRVPFALSLDGLEDKMTACRMSFPAASSSALPCPRPAHGPKLIIADEPTGNIDPEMSMDIMQLVRGHQ